MNGSPSWEGVGDEGEAKEEKVDRVGVERLSKVLCAGDRTYSTGGARFGTGEKAPQSGGLMGELIATAVVGVAE